MREEHLQIHNKHRAALAVQEIKLTIYPVEGMEIAIVSEKHQEGKRSFDLYYKKESQAESPVKTLALKRYLSREVLKIPGAQGDDITNSGLTVALRERGWESLLRISALSGYSSEPIKQWLDNTLLGLEDKIKSTLVFENAPRIHVGAQLTMDEMRFNLSQIFETHGASSDHKKNRAIITSIAEWIISLGLGNAPGSNQTAL